MEISVFFFHLQYILIVKPELGFSAMSLPCCPAKDSEVGDAKRKKEDVQATVKINGPYGNDKNNYETILIVNINIILTV